jgi:hypothetical protein
MASVEPEVKTCVVCGFASHRTDWIRTSGDYVACDIHSVDEMNKAIVSAKKAVAKEPTPANAQKSVPMGTAAPSAAQQAVQTAPAPTADAQAKTAS